MGIKSINNWINFVCLYFKGWPNSFMLIRHILLIRFKEKFKLHFILFVVSKRSSNQEIVSNIGNNLQETILLLDLTNRTEIKFLNVS